jgi:hypothetical protein
MPTLVVGDSCALDWPTLADAAESIASLIDSRMRSLQILLPRLAMRAGTNTPYERPDDASLAKALNCRSEVVADFRQSRMNDDKGLLDRIVPVLAYFVGIERAVAAFADLKQRAHKTEILEAMEQFQDQLPMGAESLFAAVASTLDLAEIRRALQLDLGRFNGILVSLDREPISNAAEMIRLFAVWKNEHRAKIENRLRRRYFAAFEAGENLDDYVQYRTLEFIEMPSDWPLNYEEVTSDMVATLAAAVMDQKLGPDVPRDLTPLAETKRLNERRLIRFCETARPIVSAWCYHKGGDIGVWSDSAIAITKALDDGGLLDFSVIGEKAEIDILARGALWPNGMPQSLALDILGLTPADLELEQKREQERREKEAKQRRSINFAGQSLDTLAPDFAESLIAIANEQMGDGSWLKRSRVRFQLEELGGTDGSSGRSSSGSGGKRGRQKPSDELKQAMGFASEFLVSRYLAEKHKRLYTDACWVSSNRGLIHVGDPGDDQRGYDFEVRLVEGDWRYEVKSSLDDACEFEFTQNEMRVAAEYAADGKHKYRILYVPFVFEPAKWRVMELPNPMSAVGRKLFSVVGSGATRMRFELK